MVNPEWLHGLLGLTNTIGIQLEVSVLIQELGDQRHTKYRQPRVAL